MIKAIYRKAEVPKLFCLGDVSCISCNYEWEAIWELGSEDLYCPKCNKNNTERTIEKRLGEHEVDFYKIYKQ